jgi:hypothetical protein
VQIVDLPGAMLASANGGRLRIDPNAAGYGWHIDPALGGADSPEGRMDLLTAVTHEMGHLLGFEHSDDFSVMAPVLHPDVTLPVELAARDVTQVSIRPLDIVLALQADKYLTGNTASRAEGDWNGDQVFDQRDIVAILQANAYSADDLDESVEVNPNDGLFADEAAVDDLFAPLLV